MAADGEDSTQYFRRWARREYLTKHERQRRANAKAEGARRLDVTLNAKALDDYATVRRYVEGLNRLLVERNLPPIRLSDTEIVTMALRQAAASMLEDVTKRPSRLAPISR